MLHRQKSSAELSEAINSMYTWYQKAKCCYVYMQDVSGERQGLRDDADPTHRLLGTRYGGLDTGMLLTDDDPVALSPMRIFRQSRWFSRGWTLQELLAPAQVQFRTRDWALVATLPQVVLAVSDVTGIDVDVLTRVRPVQNCLLAERLPWASGRITTRAEDAAYSLFGICDVNMPLSYGERNKAFMRLQLEMLRVTDDASLFA
jgi:hypothetical protein